MCQNDSKTKKSDVNASYFWFVSNQIKFKSEREPNVEPLTVSNVFSSICTCVTAIGDIPYITSTTPLIKQLLYKFRQDDEILFVSFQGLDI